MPAVSQKQRAYLNWKFGHAWVRKHHFDNKGPLPQFSHGKHGALHKLLAPSKRRRR